MKNLTFKPPKGWHYCGDINLEHGGIFYKPTEYGYAEVIEVTPCSDAGCQNNAWWVSQGGISTDVRPEYLHNALDYCGLDSESPYSDRINIECLYQYGGMPKDSSCVVQIGPDDKYAHDFVPPTIRKREGTSLENFVRKWAIWD